jgi:hypothetical protein
LLQNHLEAPNPFPLLPRPQEALNANTSLLEAVRKENEQVIAELNKIKRKAGKLESTSRINGIIKSVAGIFRS